MRQAHKYVDALAPLASKNDIPDKEIDVKIIKKILRVVAVNLIPANPVDGQDLSTFINEDLFHLSSVMVRRSWKIFFLLMTGFTFEVAMELAREEFCIHDLFVVIMILVFIDACKGKGITSLRWPKRLDL